MSDDITQKLGFDASGAINELNKLDKSLGSTSSNLKGLGASCNAVVAPAKAAKSAWDLMIGKAEELRTAALNAQKSLAMLGTSQINLSKNVDGTAGRITGAWDLMIGKAEQFRTAALNAQKSLAMLGTSQVNLSKNIDGTAGRMTGAWDSMINKSAELKKSQVDLFKQGAMLGGSGVVTREAENATRGIQGIATATAEADRQAQSFTLSWKTIGRVIQAQFIVRIMGAINRAISDSTKLARELSIAVGEISTIAGGDLGGVQQITSEVLELSRLVGLAPKEVAEGLYQTLSNQVVAAGDSIRFETEAAKLSTATHAELKDGVNALSSAMNAYGKSVDEVGRVSDVLFKGVELGRFRLEQVADIMGRTLPIAAQMGVEFEEVTAAMAVMTRQGVPVDTALTQIGQVTQKLLKPSKALSEVYAKWGVTGGKEAIERFGGLLEVLEKLKEEAAGNAQQFAAFMSRERALVGAMAMLTSGGDDLRRVLDEIYASTGASDKAFAQMEDTIGRKSVKAWNEVTIEITKMGEQLLWVSTNFAAVAKFLVQNISLIVSSGFVLFLASAGTQGNILSSIFARLAISGAAFKAVLLGPVGIVAGLAILTYALVKARQASQDTHTAILESQRKANESLLKDQQRSGAQRIEEAKKEHRERVKLTADYITNLSQQFGQIRAITTSEFSAIEGVAKAKLKGLSSELETIFKELATAGTKADKAMETSAQEVARTKQLIDDSAFERSVRYMTEEQKLVQQMMRAQKTALEAEKEYRDAAGNEELAKLAREKSVLSEKQLAEAKSTAESIRNSKEGYAAKQQAAYKLDEIEWQLEKSRKKRIEAELSFQKQREKLQAQGHRVRVAQLEEQVKLLSELLELQRQLSDPQTVGDEKERGRVEGQIRSTLEKIYGNIDVAKLLGTDKAIDQLVRGMLTATDQAADSMQSSWVRLQTQIESRGLVVPILFKGTDGITAKIIEGLGLPETIDPGQQTQQNVKIAEAIRENYTEAVNEVKNLKQQIELANKPMHEVGLSATQLTNSFKNLTLMGFGNLIPQELADRITSVTNESRAISDILAKATIEGRALTAEESKRVALQKISLVQLGQSQYANESIRALLLSQLNSLSGATTKLQRIQQLTTVLGQLRGPAQQAEQYLSTVERTATAEEKKLPLLEQLNNAIQRANEAESKRNWEILKGKDNQENLNEATKLLTPQLENGAQAAAQFNAQTQANKTATDSVTTATGGISTGLNIATATAGQLEAAMARVEQRAVAAARAIAAATAAAGSVNAQSGGRISHHNHKYFAGGGLNRGLDTIPARLSAGEFVTNTKSARRFHAQLQAINAGQTPVYRDQGGQVTNVGDIHVTVQQGNSPQQSVHEIARALNREIKRGTVRFQ